MLRRLFAASALVALASPVLRADVVAPGWGHDATRPLSAATAFSAHDSLNDGRRVVFDGTIAWIESDDGTLLLVLGGTPAPTFASFVEVDPSQSFALLGESSNGVIYRAPLAGGGLTPVCVLPNNFDLAFAGPGAAYVSAATSAAPYRDEVHLIDLATGSTQLIASVDGASGPLAIDGAGGLLCGALPYLFPAPPGSVRVLRWSAAQLAAGPFPLDEPAAATFAGQLDGAYSLAVDAESGRVFVSESVYGSTSRVLEFDRAGVRVGEVASSPDYIGKVEVLDAPGDGACAAYQPAGRALKYRTTDYNQGTSQILTVSPRRPALASAQNADGTMTCTLSGALPGSSAYVISGPAALNSPTESVHDLGPFLLWTGLPLGSIRRAGIQFPVDAAGTGSFTFWNPPSIQGTRVIQVFVRDAGGVFRGASTAALN